MNLKIIHTKNKRWIDIENPGQAEISYLRQHFSFHELDYQDVASFAQQPKLTDYGSYLFLVLLFPVFDRKTREIWKEEVDFFIGEDYLITVHYGRMYTLRRLWEETHQSDARRRERMAGKTGMLLYSVLEALFGRIFPMLNHVGEDIASVEKRLFSRFDARTLEEIARLRKNVISFRRIMKMHKFIMLKLVRLRNSFLLFQDSRLYYQNLIEQAENIWDVLASDKETVESFQDTNEALVGHRTAEILRTLTVFSVIIFLLTLITALASLTFSASPRFARSAIFLEGFMIIFFGVILAMLVYFRRRRWL